MGSEFTNWIQDLSRYAIEWRKRSELHKPDAGVDYTGDEYRDSARRTVERIHPRNMRLKLTEIIEETATTKTLRFARTDAKLPPFRAGQYVNLFLEVNGVRTSRPYSISSAPGADHLDLTVREKPGGFVSTHLLSKLKVGDEFNSTGPAGSLYYESLIDRGDLVFLAGGSGITPFMSMIRHQEKLGWKKRIHLIYGSRTIEDVIFREELDRLSKDNPMFNYALLLSEPPAGFDGATGFLTDHIIGAHVGDLTDKTFLICGPNVMIDFTLDSLGKLDVPRHKIRRELYGPPDQVSEEPGWPDAISAEDEFTVEVEGVKSIRVRAGEPLINAFERDGIQTPPPLCRSGECSYCRMRLLSGRVFMPAHTGLRESDRNNNFIHACVAYPISDLKVGF